MQDEIKQIIFDLGIMRDLFSRVVKMVPKFDVVNPEILPYGLKPNTRSVSWIIEQVIVQQIQKNLDVLGIQSINYDISEIGLHDCEIVDLSGRKHFVNIKITKTKKKQRRWKNDIAAIKKLYDEYTALPYYNVIYAICEFDFDNTIVDLKAKNVTVFSPQFLPLYINMKNGKLQAYYDAEWTLRTRDEFIEELKTAVNSL